jgi:hypothetical protein
MRRTLKQSGLFLATVVGGLLVSAAMFVGGYAVGYVGGESEGRARYLNYQPVPTGDFHPFRSPPAQSPDRPARQG